MKIQLLFFGITTDLTEKNSMVIEVESTTSVKNLKQQFKVDSMNDVFLKLARNIE